MQRLLSVCFHYTWFFGLIDTSCAGWTTVNTTVTDIIVDGGALWMPQELLLPRVLLITNLVPPLQFGPRLYGRNDLGAVTPLHAGLRFPGLNKSLGGGAAKVMWLQLIIGLHVTLLSSEQGGVRGKWAKQSRKYSTLSAEVVMLAKSEDAFPALEASKFLIYCKTFTNALLRVSGIVKCGIDIPSQSI